MKVIINILLFVFIMNTTPNLYAQKNSSPADTSLNASLQSMNYSPEAVKLNGPGESITRNIVKINLAPLLLKSYSLQYERVLNRKISLAVQYRLMPETEIPFKSMALKIVGDEDPDTKKIIEDFKMSNYAITPEVRIYLSRKGYGHGFYFAPFYRYASFTSNDLNVFYNDDNDVQQSVKMSGKLTSNTYGFMLGVQSALGKHILLDWSILGPHVGTAKGDFSGRFTKPLSSDEQLDMQQSLEDIDIPFTDKTVDVNANTASMKIDGPWAGFRFNFALGFRF